MKLSFDEKRRLVMEAVRRTWPEAFLEELYDDEVVFGDGAEMKPGGVPAFRRASWALVDGRVQLGEAEAVERQVSYVRVAGAVGLVAAAAAPTPERWRVRVLGWGVDKVGTEWTPEACRAALGLFNAARVFALEEAQHQDPGKRHPMGKSVREIVGWLEAAEVTAEGVEADLVFASTGAWLAELVADAWQKGKRDLVGLSVDVLASAHTRTAGGRRVRTPVKIVAVDVDVVYNPAAGGQFLRLAAACGRTEESEMRDRLLAALRRTRPDLAATVTDETTDQQLVDLLAAEPPAATPKAPAAAPTDTAVADALRETRLLACRLQLRDELAASKLPEPVAKKLSKQFEGQVFELATLTAAIAAEKETLDALSASGHVHGVGEVRVGTDDLDARAQMLDDFFSGDKGVHSFKACYQHVTGDVGLTGRTAEARLLASLTTTSWGEILGDAITRRMLADYRMSGLDDWRKLADVVPLGDFRTQHRMRLGGYGDLPTVAQAGPYTALASPADEEATYSASKKGGTEDLTWEMLLADDVGAIRRIPQKLSRAAARTLYKFVFDFLANNAAIYDGTALFHADHANLLTTALDATQLKASRLKMLKQTEAGSSEPLGISPLHLIVPLDLVDTAYALTVAANAGNFVPTAADAVRSQTWSVIGVKHWTDTNNWYLAADKADIPLIEVGFVGGREEPELFVQDQPTQGSMFSNDKLTYKIRHAYGGTVVEYRGFQGNVVA